MQADLIIPAPNGLETIHYRLAYLIALNCGINPEFVAEYGPEESWQIDGEIIPIDAGEFLNFIREKLS